MNLQFYSWPMCTHTQFLWPVLSAARLWGAEKSLGQEKISIPLSPGKTGTAASRMLGVWGPVSPVPCHWTENTVWTQTYWLCLSPWACRKQKWPKQVERRLFTESPGWARASPLPPSKMCPGFHLKPFQLMSGSHRPHFYGNVFPSSPAILFHYVLDSKWLQTFS